MTRLHSVGEIAALQNELQLRAEKLLHAMAGAAPSELDHRLEPGLDPGRLGTHRYVDGQAVRLATDDFSTVLREIKRALGK